MSLFRAEALVLSTIDFSESTQIARFYSPERGKFSALARGVKRFTSRLGPRLEAFALVDVRVYAREHAAMGTLSAIELLRDWPWLRTDLERHALSALVFETLDRGVEEGKPGAELFRLAVAYLEAMADAPDPEGLTAHTLLRQLCLLGFAPDLREPGGDMPEDTPADSLQSNRLAPGAERLAPWLFFHTEEGRLSRVAPSDPRAPRIRLDPESRRFLRHSMGLSLEEFAGVAAPVGRARPILAILIQLLQRYLELELRSARFLRKMVWNA